MRGVVVLGLVVGVIGAIASPSALAAGSASARYAPLPFTVGASGPALRVSVPARATLHQQFQIRVRLPRAVSVAAFETAVLADDRALEVTAGVPGNGLGQMLEPAFSPSAARVGFYGGTASGSRDDLLDIIVTPDRTGRIRIRLTLPLGVDRAGRIVPLRYDRSEFTVQVGGSRRVWRPRVTARSASLRPRATLRYDVAHDGTRSRADLYQAVRAWDSTAANGLSGGATGREGDVDGDGYTTVRDLQLLDHVLPRQRAVGRTLAAAFAPARTWVVNTTSDAGDAHPGDGVCATAAGTCSLRAAIDEANRAPGDDLIDFAIPGGAPQTIQLGGALTQINSAAGGIEIDGYSEPGARANTDPTISNALPGVVIDFAGAGRMGDSLQITSANNIVRGLAFGTAGRAIDVLGPTAQNNSIVGDFFGMNATGTFAAATGYAGIDVDGAARNLIGTPALADRNVFAGFEHAVVENSPGAVYDVIQNNLIGMSPNGVNVRGSTNDDIDHNVGPQHDLIGGPDPGDRNVFAGGSNGVEYSHGWNQSKPPRVDTSAKYQVDDNTIQGNYIGYAPDGHFAAKYLVAAGQVGEQNGSGVNVIDVSNRNLVEGNWISSHVNGVQIIGYQTENNVVRDNHIGISPLGTPGYIGFSGVSVRWNAANEQIIGNDIHNTGLFTSQGPPPASTPNAYGCIDNTSNRAEGCGAGIRVNEPADTGVLVSQNTFSNIGNGIGIDLAPLGVFNANDPGDTDRGPNTLLNYPVITAAATDAVAGTACAGCTVELSTATGTPGQHGLATLYVGSTVASASGVWELVPPAPVLAAGMMVNAIAIDASSNTSEEGADVAVVQGATIIPPVPPVTPVTPVTPVAPATPADPATAVATATAAPAPATVTAAAVPLSAGRLIVFDRAARAYRVSIDGSTRIARLGRFGSAVVGGLAPGTHTLAVATIGGRARHASRVVHVLSGRSSLAVVSNGPSGPRLRASLVAAPAVGVSSAGVVLVNLTAQKLALKVDAGATRTVGGSTAVLAGLSLGAHTLHAALAGRRPASAGPAPAVARRVTLAAGGYAVVMVAGDGRSLRASSQTVAAG